MYDWRNKFIKPSSLDNFQAFLDGELFPGFEYTTERFVNDLLKLTPPSIKMTVGTTMHKVMELSKYTELPQSFVMDDWVVVVNINESIEVPVIREVPIKHNIAGIDLNGKIDAIDGYKVHDFKFTSKVDINKYIKSWQWKVYLEMVNYNKFIYDLFTINIDEENNTININAYDKLELYRYPSLTEDVKQIIENFKDTLSNLKSTLVDVAQQNNITIKGLI
jgi:hypothetical protein